MHIDYSWGMGVGGWLFMIVFLAFSVLGALYLIRLISEGAKKGRAGETALDILKKRYAKGEIGKEEFEEKKKDLGV